jgi:Tfp pilus assembly protein PilO
MDTEKDDSEPKKPSKLTVKLIEALHNPIQLRVLLIISIFGGWYALSAASLTEEIDRVTRQIERERKRLELALEVERLRTQVARFQHRLPEKVDVNELPQYLLNGVRGFPLRPISCEPDTSKDVGPYKARSVNMTVQGPFPAIEKFLRWVESNPRLLRVDKLQLSPIREGTTMNASLTVLGITG